MRKAERQNKSNETDESAMDLSLKLSLDNLPPVNLSNITEFLKVTELSTLSQVSMNLAIACFGSMGFDLKIINLFELSSRGTNVFDWDMTPHVKLRRIHKKTTFRELRRMWQRQHEIQRRERWEGLGQFDTETASVKLLTRKQMCRQIIHDKRYRNETYCYLGAMRLDNERHDSFFPTIDPMHCYQMKYFDVIKQTLSFFPTIDAPEYQRLGEIEHQMMEFSSGGRRSEKLLKFGQNPSVHHCLDILAQMSDMDSNNQLLFYHVKKRGDVELLEANDSFEENGLKEFDTIIFQLNPDHSGFKKIWDDDDDMKRLKTEHEQKGLKWNWYVKDWY
jgi:hypothetical protein